MSHIKLQKMKNCRDLGGFMTEDGRKIKEKSLIRSEALFEASQSDIEKLKNEYNLKTVIDFRTDIECEQKPDPDIPGVKYIHNPILRAQTLGITRERVAYRDMPKLFENISVTPLEYMSEMYRNLVLDESAMTHYKEFFRILIEEDGAFLWHCTAGKDRVGIGTALLLSALGVSREDIINDYLMTDYYYRFTNAKLNMMISLGVRDKNVRTYLRWLLSVKREYICASFSAVEEKYGSVEAYLQSVMGLDGEKIAALKEKFLEKQI